MTISKIIIIMLSFLTSSFASDEYITISKKIDALSDKIILSQASPRKLFQIRVNLKFYKHKINQCIHFNQLRYNFIQEKLNSVSSWNSNEYLINKHRNELMKLKKIEDNLNICRLAKYNQEHLHKLIVEYNQINFIRSFYRKYESIIKIYKKIDFSSFEFPSRGYVFKMLVQETNFKRMLVIFSTLIFAIFLIKLYNKNHQLRNIPLVDIEWKRLFQIFLIFTFTSPVPYLALKTSYIHHDEVLLDIYKKPSTVLLSFIVFLYLLRNYDRNSFKKDVMIILPSILIEGLLIAFGFSINYFDLYNISEVETIFVKYVVLIFEYCCVFLIYYWLFVRILQKEFYHTIFFKIFFLTTSVIFLFGLHGYIDMAVCVIFSIICFLSMFVWVVLFGRFRKLLVHIFSNPSSRLENLLIHLFDTDKNKVIFNIKFFINFLYSFIFIQVVFIGVISSVFFFSSDIIYDIYEWIYTQQSIGGYNFILINYIYAIGLFLILNVISYGVSTNLAKRFFKDPILKQKTAHFFHIIGLLINLLICLIVTHIDIHNIILLFGGLLLGIGFGLKNILTNILSSALIYLNRPFEIGDFIGIGNYKGYVSKIGVLETAIKTEDSDTVILPNQNIASSIIQNYTFNNKKNHKVHIKYLIMNMNEQDEIKIQNMILHILKNDENVVIDQEKYYQFLFSADTQNIGAFQLELVFTVNTLRYLKRITNDINLRIIDELKKESIELRFISISHALITGS